MRKKLLRIIIAILLTPVWITLGFGMVMLAIITSPYWIFNCIASLVDFVFTGEWAWWDESY